MTPQQRREIKQMIRDEMEYLGHQPFTTMGRDSTIERILDELEKIWPSVPTFRVGTTPSTLISADPLGADRKAREI
jgi:hypothetical protein